MSTLLINGIEYTIPQELDLINSFDERTEAYRISIGKVDPTEAEQSQYAAVFTALDSRKLRSGFIEAPITFTQNNQRLTMLLSMVDVYKKSFGTFYEIESGIEDTTFSVVKEQTINDRTRGANTVTSKKTNGKRKVTSKGKRASSRA
jgi:hypothetical protein